MINIKKYTKIAMAILLPVFNMECTISNQDPMNINRVGDLGSGTIDLLQNEESWRPSVMTTANTPNRSQMMDRSTYSTPARKRGNNELSTSELRTPNNKKGKTYSSLSNVSQSSELLAPNSQRCNTSLSPLRDNSCDQRVADEQCCTPKNQRIAGVFLRGINGGTVSLQDLRLINNSDGIEKILDTND